MQGDVQVIMEASGPYYLGLASYVYAQGIPVSVVNPLVIRRYGQMRLSRTKTDAKDAALIAPYALTNNRLAGSRLLRFVRLSGNLMSLREGLLRQRAVLTGQHEAFSQNKDIEPLVYQVIDAQDKALTQSLRKIDDQMQALAETHYGPQLRKLLYM